MAVEDESEVRQIGRYAILERLDAGGSAEVFVAQREGDAKLCVLKRLHTRLEAHRTAPKRLYREAHLASLLRHPHIAEIIGAGIEDGRFVMAFEFVAGQTIESLIQMIAVRGRRVPLELCMGIAFAVLDGLEYAHDLADPDGKPLEIVHRDISPRNVLVGYDGVVKLIDFGIARGNFDEFRTEPGVVVGTLRYLSPEQALTVEVDRRSDLYSLAVVLFELLTGKPVVPDCSPLDILRYVINEPAPNLCDVEPSIPRVLEPIIARALAKDRELRFPDARSFKEALARIPNLPRPAGPQRLGALARELFPEGVTWAAKIAEAASANARSKPRRAAEEARTLASSDVINAQTLTFGDATDDEKVEDPDATEIAERLETAPTLAATSPSARMHSLSRVRREVDTSQPPLNLDTQPMPQADKTVISPMQTSAELHLLKEQVAVLQRRARALAMIALGFFVLTIFLTLSLVRPDLAGTFHPTPLETQPVLSPHVSVTPEREIDARANPMPIVGPDPKVEAHEQVAVDEMLDPDPNAAADPPKKQARAAHRRATMLPRTLRDHPSEHRN